MTIDPQAIEAAIVSAPAWALIGLAMPQESLREDARRELATHLFGALYAPLCGDQD